MNLHISPEAFALLEDGVCARIDTLTAAQVSATEAAIEHCAKAFTRAYNRAISEGHAPKEARQRGVAAYKVFMPRMEDRESVLRFIACTVSAMQTDVISGQESSKLLYAAQVALAALGREK